MDLQLNGRAALVTGASTGIGRGIARTLANEGARLALSARRRELLEQLCDEIERAGAPRPAIVCGDLSKADEVANIAAESQQTLGAIDILVNVAGSSTPITAESGEEDWDDAFTLNFRATRALTQALLPAMRQRGWGRVICFGGSMEPRGVNAGTAAKAALHAWAKGLSREIAADGVTINVVQPGRINSEQILNRLYPSEAARREFIEQNIPIGYFGEPEDVSILVAFLASPLARYITGAFVPVDGGMHYYVH